MRPPTPGVGKSKELTRTAPGLARKGSATALVGGKRGSTYVDPSTQGAVAKEEQPTHKAIVSAMRGYFMALMLVLIVGSLGILLAALIHGYTFVDSLFWTVGCMTTAGGDLRADSSLLQVLYTFYMPLAAVAALTAARTIIQTSFLREIRLDKYELKVHSLLQQEAAIKQDASLRMRENDFVIAVLRQRKLIDIETVDAIRAHFTEVIVRSGDGRPSQREGAAEYDPVIDATVVYKHLIRQQRVQPLSRKPADHELSAIAGLASAGTGAAAAAAAAAAQQLQSTVYVDMSTPDEGFQEWFDNHWEATIEPSEVVEVVGDDPVDGAGGKEGYARLLDA